MANLTVYLSALLLLSVACFEMSHGLECYQCMHADDLDGFSPGEGVSIDKSCKSGKKPKSEFAKNCDQQGARQFIAAMSGVTNITDMAEPLKTVNQVTWICAKGTTKLVDQSVTARGCLPVLPTEQSRDSCNDVTLQDLIDDYGLEPEFGFDPSLVKIHLCKCTGDKCNSALSSFTFSISVLVASMTLTGLTWVV